MVSKNYSWHVSNQSRPDVLWVDMEKMSNMHESGSRILQIQTSSFQLPDDLPLFWSHNHANRLSINSGTKEMNSKTCSDLCSCRNVRQVYPGSNIWWWKTIFLITSAWSTDRNSVRTLTQIHNWTDVFKDEERTSRVRTVPREIGWMLDGVYGCSTLVQTIRLLFRSDIKRPWAIEWESNDDNEFITLT